MQEKLKNIKRVKIKKSNFLFGDRNHKNLDLNSNNSKKKNKIHRRFIPKLKCTIPRGIAAKLVARTSRHNWHYNYDLINLRRKLGMRIHARSELCQALTVLSSVLIIYCNYNLYSDYLFEVSVPFEVIASSMNMLHVYENGRKSYDPPLHALRILEKLKYLIILRDRDPDTGHCKPLRIWLTKRFFESRGIKVKDLRIYLSSLEKWVIRKNLTSTLIKNKNKHLTKMRIIGIDLLKFPSLRNLLLKIKKNILGIKLIEKVNNNIRLSNCNPDFLRFIKNRKSNSKRSNNIFKIKKFINGFSKSNENKEIKSSKFWYCKFINWSITKMPYQIFLLEKSLRIEKPELMNNDPEKYYKTLMKRGENLNIKF